MRKIKFLTAAVRHHHHRLIRQFEIVPQLSAPEFGSGEKARSEERILRDEEEEEGGRGGGGGGMSKTFSLSLCIRIYVYPYGPDYYQIIHEQSNQIKIMLSQRL